MTREIKKGDIVVWVNGNEIIYSKVYWEGVKDIVVGKKSRQMILKKRVKTKDEIIEFIRSL